MTDQTPIKPLTDFTPVPRQCERHDGWTPERQRLFIEALADYGSVRAACDSVGLTTVGAYRLRRQPGAESFASAWEAALAHGMFRLRDALMDRALNGVEVPVYSYGKLIGTRTSYDNRLGMFMLRNRLPEEFCAGGPRALNAVGKMELERLKKQWRDEWLTESDAEEEEARASLDTLLETMHANRLSHMSPAQRERQVAADAQGRADAAAGWTPGTPYRAHAEEAARLLPKFIAEAEAEWPPLPSWAWDAPEPACDPAPPMALPPPAEEPAGPEQSRKAEPEPPAGPRVRTLKDSDW